MGNPSLVIVESPTKARTIARFLGDNYTVRASNGHIRDLPNSAAEIPARYKKEKWARLGVDVANGFRPLYVIPRDKQESVKALKEALKGADVVYLATDEDREGESISWHVYEVLSPKVPVRRMVFHEITKEAIRKALETPRDVDLNLVRAQETRRIVDRLFGYEVSPLLWKKMLPRLSAGRVQSVAVRLLVERERERIRFCRACFWGIKGILEKRDGSKAHFEAELTHWGEKRIAVGKDFDANTGRLRSSDAVLSLNEQDAARLVDEMRQQTARVLSVEEKPYSTNPAPPFVTSTLQQEANRKLRFSAKHTMSLAQRLYENGFITYMRTDSTSLSEEALNAARTLIAENFGESYLPAKPRYYRSSVRNAQEAHEAIRPAGANFTPPSAVAKKVGSEAGRLYELIWKRTVASQMANAEGTHIAVQVECGMGRFRASGKTISFPGFIRAYVEGADEPEAELADLEKVLPHLSENELLSLISLDSSEHTTQPPARYTEGSLIKELERLGIGRPSTWATIVELVLNRAYAFKKGNTLVPTFIALGIIGLLEKHFDVLLDYGFTARLEDDLDSIARGEAKDRDYLSDFYFGNSHRGLKVLIEEGEANIDPRDVCSIPLGEVDGRILEVRIGRYGPFLSDGERRASVPDMFPPDELTLAAAVNILDSAAKGPESLGVHPETGQNVYLKNGPYGPYVQLGESAGDNGKPKMASLLRNMSVENLDLATAVKLLSLPRTLGSHPDDGAPVIASNGRFGPFLRWGKETRSIPVAEFSPLDITLEQAIELFKQPKGTRRSQKPEVIRSLGNHPVSEAALSLMKGRYGPYVTDGSINASLPRGMDVDSISIEDAVTLLEARAAKESSAPSKKRTKKSTRRNSSA